MITVRYRKLASGKYSIYLDCYNETTKERKYEFLKLYVGWDYSQKQNILAEDKAAMQTVQSILDEKQKSNFTIKTDETPSEPISLLSFIESLHKKDIATYTKQLSQHLKNYLSEKKDIDLCKIDTSWIDGFKKYCNENHSLQLTARLLTQFKTVLNIASKNGLIADNTFKPLTVLPVQVKEPDCLTDEEIVKLEQTPVTFNSQIRDAFLFSLYSGLRWQDVKTLQWKAVSETVNGSIKRYMLTLSHMLSKTVYTIELNPAATSILLKYSGNKKDNECGKLVFDKLPNMTNCHSKIRLWGYIAGLNRNVYFSMARNTFLCQSIHKNHSVAQVCKELGLQKTRRVKILSQKLKNHDSNPVQGEPGR